MSDAGDGGRTEPRPEKYTLDAILGSVEALPNESPDLEYEIVAAVAAAFAERHGLETAQLDTNAREPTSKHKEPPE